MSTPEKRRLADALQVTESKTQKIVWEWVSWLEDEKRASRHTLDAYQRDIRSFFVFMAEHVGGNVLISDLADLSAQDIRAWLAHEKEQGKSASSIARALSVVRSFFKWAQREQYFENNAIVAVRNPKQPMVVPKACLLLKSPTCLRLLIVLVVTAAGGSAKNVGSICATKPF